MNSRRGFSLIELIVVIAVIAVISAIIAWRIYGVAEGAKNVAEAESIKLWNSSYLNVTAAGYITSDGVMFSTLDWTHASALMSAGVEIPVGSSFMSIQANTPVFRSSGAPAFTPGKGITAPPSGP